jgi:hypothetical protein
MGFPSAESFGLGESALNRRLTCSCSRQRAPSCEDLRNERAAAAAVVEPTAAIMKFSGGFMRIASFLGVTMGLLLAGGTASTTASAHDQQPPPAAPSSGIGHVGSLFANVVHGHFQRRGQTDWAVICSRNRVSTLVFWGGRANNVSELEQRPDTNFLQSWSVDTIVFSRSIAVAPEARIRDYFRRDEATPPCSNTPASRISFSERRRRCGIGARTSGCV